MIMAVSQNAPKQGSKVIAPSTRNASVAPSVSCDFLISAKAVEFMTMMSVKKNSAAKTVSAVANSQIVKMANALPTDIFTTLVVFTVLLDTIAIPSDDEVRVSDLNITIQ